MPSPVSAETAIGPSRAASEQFGAMVFVQLVELVPDLDQFFRGAGDADFA